MELIVEPTAVSDFIIGKLYLMRLEIYPDERRQKIYVIRTRINNDLIEFNFTFISSACDNPHTLERVPLDESYFEKLIRYYCSSMILNSTHIYSTIKDSHLNVSSRVFHDIYKMSGEIIKH